MADAADQLIGPLVGVADHCGAFLELCRQRIERLNVSYDTVDAICGFPTRYTAKIMAESKGLSAFTLFVLARGLALLPTFTHDADQHQALQAHSQWIANRWPALRNRRKHSARKHSLGPDFLRNRALRANLERTRKLKPKRRREIARNAALARWSRVRSTAT
jgi:hypothetical protein